MSCWYLLFSTCFLGMCVLVNAFIILVPAAAPLNPLISNITSQSMRLSWNPPTIGEQNGILLLYHVIIVETPILYLDNGSLSSPMGMSFNRTYNVSEGLEQLIEMLHPSYNYTVRIAAATAAGIGPFSDPITVMTLEDGEYLH